MNKAILVGRVGKDPEIRTFESGKMATFSLATSEKYTKDGEKKELTEWHNIVVNGKLAEVVEKYVHKGDQLYIEGKIRYQEYEAQGVKKTSTKITCTVMEMLGSKERAEPRETNFPEEPPAGWDEPKDDLPF